MCDVPTRDGQKWPETVGGVPAAITITITICYWPLASRTDIGLQHPSTTSLQLILSNSPAAVKEVPQHATFCSSCLSARLSLFIMMCGQGVKQKRLQSL